MTQSIEKIFLSVDRRKEEQFDPYTGNTDVIVHLDNGEKYTASFFAYKNIEKKALENKLNENFMGGKYIWFNNMVLIESCTKDLITEVVQEMIDEGEFHKAFLAL